jgi:DUF971 family protein
MLRSTLPMKNNDIPSKVELATSGTELTLSYSDTGTVTLCAELLRVYSPSAEVRGHGVGNEVLQTGKRHVLISNIEQVGNYALKFTYSDGHDSGIYTWKYLKDLSLNAEVYWSGYLKKLEQAAASRDKQ